MKSDVDKLDINKLKNIATGLNNLKDKEDKLDIDKLASVPVDLSKLSKVIKMMLLKKRYIILRSKILKMRCLILLT